MQSVRFAAGIALTSCIGLRSSMAFAQPADRASAGPGAHVETVPKTPEWGVGGVTYYSIGAAEFLPKDSISTYATDVSPAGRYATSSGRSSRRRRTYPAELC